MHDAFERGVDPVSELLTMTRTAPEAVDAAVRVQWSEVVIKADPFFGRSRVRFHKPPWVLNTIARDHLA